MKNLYLSVLMISICLLANTIHAQTFTVQDCIGAIPICSDRYVETNIPSGIGNVNDINPALSCFRLGEAGEERGSGEVGSSIWYTFTVNNTGQFGFVINPASPDDDYDFALFNLTNAECGEIRTNSNLEVSCNYSATLGSTGPNGAVGAAFEDLLTVQAGNTYALLVSSYTPSTQGYTIDFGATDANTGIFDLDPPEFREDLIVFPTEICNRTIELGFSENIDCNSLGGFDAILEGPPGAPTYSLRASIPECNQGALGARRVFVEISPSPQIVGEYTLTIPNRPNPTYFADACGNPFSINRPDGSDLVYSFTLEGSLELAIEASQGDICQDGSLTLTAKVPASLFSYSIEWSNGVSGSGFTPPKEITITEPGIYSVTVNGGGPCSIGTASITIDGGVTLDLGDDRTGICASDGPQILDAGEGEAYLWSTGATTRTISVNQTNTYAVTVSPDCGAPVEDEIFVSFIPNINFNPETEYYECSSDIPITIGQDIGTDFDYLWDDGSTSPTISVSSSGQYRVTVSNACEAEERTIQLTLETVPVGGYVIEDFTICPGEANIRSFNLSSFASIAWTGTSGTSSSSSYNITQPGQHGFIVSNACGNFPGNFEVLNGNPNIQFSGLEQACAGETTSITASGGVSYNWQPTAETTSRIDAQAGQTYTVEVTSAAGCTDSESISINTLPAATASITGNTEFCVGESTTLTVNSSNPNDTYLWSTGETSASITVNQANTYGVQVRTAAACEATSSVNVILNPRPSFSIQSSAACNPSLSDYSLTLNISAGAALTVDDNLVDIQQNGDLYTLTAPTGVSFNCTVTNANTNCTFTQPITAPNCSCPSVSRPSSQQTQLFYCTGASIPEINANVGTGFEVVWYNTPAGGTPIAVGNTLRPTTAGIYHAESRDLVSACVSGTRLPIEIIERALPQIRFSNLRQVCPDQNLMLTASGGTNYTWSSGQNTASINAPAGNYSVTVTDGNGCKNSDNISISNFPETIANISGNDTFCTGMQTSLTANGGVNYAWSSGQNDALIFTNQAATYTVVVTDENGCQDEESIEVVENPLPSFSTQQDATCNEALTEYTVVGTLSPDAILSTSAGIISDVNGVFTVTIPEEIDVTLTITNNITSCVNTQSVTAPDCSCPVLAAPNGGQEFFYCPEDAIPNLNASSTENNTQVRWFDVQSGGTPIAMGNDFQANQAGTYFAETIEISSGCVSSSRLAVQLTERTPPSIGFMSDGQVCVGETLTLTATGGVSYTWNSGENTATITATAGQHQVTVTDINGCTNEAATTIGEFPEAVASIVGEADFCAGMQTSLTASGGVSYTWSSGQNDALIFTNQAATYTVVVTDENGCQDEESIEVVENPLPSFSTQQDATCNEALTEYTVVGTLSPDATLSTSAGTISDANGVFTVTIPEEINVTLTITNNITGCVNTQSVTAPDCSCPVLAAPDGGQDFFYCPEDVIPTLSANSIEDNTEVRWYDVQSGGTPIAMGNDFQPNQAGTYFAETIEISSGCVSSSRLAIQLTERTPPSIGFMSDGRVCVDETLTLTATGGVNYVWDSGEASATITAAAGQHQVTVTDINGCANEAATTIGEFPEAVASIAGEADFCAGTQTSLTASGGVNYAWSSGQNDALIFTNQAATYTVVVTDANGCQDEESIEVVENPLPSFSTQQDATCNEALTEYTVVGTLSPDAILSTSAGIISDVNGVFTVTIPEEIDVTLTITNNITSCVNTQSVTAPDCSCPVLAAPNGGQEFFYCPEDAIPNLNASSTENNTQVRWFDVQSGGTPIAMGNDFQPNQAGTYFAETVEMSSGCVSSSRLAVQLTERTPPNIGFMSDGQVCVGETLTLTATGGLSYTWDSGENTASITATAGQHQVTVTDINGCTNEAATTISEFPEAVASIVGEADFCAGMQTNLTASGGVNYAWSSGQNDALIFTNQAAILSVTVTDANGCQDEESIQVVENPLPSFTTQQDATCNEALTEYTVVGTLSPDATLSTSAGTISDANGVFTVTIPEEIDVTLTITNTITGCVSTQSVTAPDCSCPVLAAPNGGQEFFYCPEDVIPTLNANSIEDNTEVRWFDVQSGGTPIAMGNDFQPNQAGTYFAETVEMSSGCVSSSRLVVQLTERTSPSIGFMSDGQVCVGKTLTLTATGGVSYAWDSGEASATITATAGQHRVTVTDTNGCTNEAATTIGEFPEAVASITGEADFCTGMQTSLTASGGVSYTWSSGQNDALIFTNQAATYTVVVTDENGCQDEESIEVVENSLPSFSTQQDATCNEALTEYTVIGTLSPDATLSTSAGIISDVNGVFTVTIPEEIDVTLTITNTITGCVSTQSVTAPDCSCPVLAAPNGGQEFFYCPEDVIPTLSAASTENNTQVRWFDVQSGGTPIAMGNDFQANQAGTYFAETVEMSSGCVSSSRLAVQLTERTPPSIGFMSDGRVCVDETLTLTATGGVNYVWDSGEASATITAAAGQHQVTVTDINGCANEAATTIGEFPEAVASIVGEADFCAGTQTSLTASGGVNYAWSSGQNDALIFTNQAATYTVVVTDANGCQDEESIQVVENPLPSFTTQQDATCNEALTEYTVVGTLSPDATLSTSAGTISDANGVFTVTIPEEIDVTLTITNTITGCVSTQSVTAPDCSCPVLAAPNGGQEFFYCPEAAIPNLNASSTENNTQVRWFDVQSGGTPIAMGNDFQPNQAGTYFAETIEISSGCVSSSRLAVQLTERTPPSIGFMSDGQVCVGETLTLTATGGVNYVWDSGEASATITAAAGQHQVTVTDINGCANEAATTIGEFPEAVASIAGEADFCAGMQTNLTASGGVNYAWSSGESNNSIFVNQTTNVSVTITDENGCQAETDIDIRENQLPTFNTQQSAVCTEDLTSYTIIGTVSENTSMEVSAGTISENGGLYTITVAADISIEISLLDEMTGCENVFPINAPDCSCPSLAIPISDGDIAICAGDALPSLNVSLENAETLSVNWFADASATIPLANNTLEYTPTEIGTYYAQTVEISSGCVSSQLTAVTISELSLPIVAFSEANQICPDETLQLVASGGLAYVWNTGETTANIEAGEGTYSVSVTDIDGCQNEASTNITNFTPPTAIISGDETYCENESANLIGEGGTLLWSTGETNGQIVVNAGEYMLTVTDENACTDTATWTVTENALPNLTPIDNVACTPDLTAYAFQANVSENTEITMSAGTFVENGGIYSFNIPTEMNTQITLTDAGTQCTQVFEISAPNCDCPSLDSPISMGDMAICEGENIPVLQAEGGDENFAIDWYDAAIGGTLLAEASASFTPTEAGRYYVGLREIASGCVSSLRTEITLIINDLPSVSITGDDAICANETSILNAIGIGDFTWNTGDTDSNIEVSGGTYEVTITDTNNCQNLASFTVTEIASPTASILDAPAQLCENETAVIRASGAGDYLWSTGATSETITVNVAGDYGLTVTNTEACSDETSVSIMLNSVDAIQVNLGEDGTLCEDENILLDAGTFEEVTYLWQDGSDDSTFEVMQAGQYAVTITDKCANTYEDAIQFEVVSTITEAIAQAVIGQDTSLCLGEIVLDINRIELDNPGDFNFTWSGGARDDRIRVTEGGTYGLRVSNECGASLVSVEIEDCPECHIYVPNVFAPSSALDINTKMRPFLGKDCDVQNYHFRIFDRWGSLIFETQDPNDLGWDGKFRNETAPHGTYVWTMTYDLANRYGDIRSHRHSGDFLVNQR